MRSWSLAVALAFAGAVAACSGDADPEPAGPTTTPEPAATTSTPDDQRFDCGAVAAAQQTLGDAATTELERLGIDRSAPEAFTVVLLTTSQGAADYWGAIAASVGPEASEELTADVDDVAAYWAELDAELATIEVADSSPAAVQAAAAELTRVSQSRPDDALAPVQQRVQDELDAACGTQPVSPDGSSSSESSPAEGSPAEGSPS